MKVEEDVAFSCSDWGLAELMTVREPSWRAASCEDWLGFYARTCSPGRS